MFNEAEFSSGVKLSGLRRGRYRAIAASPDANAKALLAAIASAKRIADADAKADPYPVEAHVVNEYLDDAALLVVYDDKRIPKCVFDHFILGSINEQDQEKSAFVFTFGDAVLFGGMERRTRLYAYSGFLVDSQKDGKCISAWRRLYDKYLRATAMAEENRYARLFYRDQVRDGYITACRMAESADRPHTAVFNFNMFVINEST